jgi:outer membrane protein assembly factor BamD (BamD/ComL family)
MGTVSGDNAQAATLFQNAKNFEAARENKKAIKAYRQLLSKYPADKRAAESRFQEAALLRTLGQEREAFDAYQMFIERHPDNALYAQAISRQEAVAHAAAQGIIRNSFLGMKSRLERATIVGMLEKVRDNAPRANSAPRAQFAIGQVNESRENPALAIAAYQKLVDEYPRASVAPDAQFRIGETLLRQSRDGNQDKANLNRAKDAYRDLLLAYPGSSFSGQAKQRIATIGSQDLTASYNVAEFYRKKGQLDSAAFYYQEVVNGSAPGDLRNRAAARLAAIKQ